MNTTKEILIVEDEPGYRKLIYQKLKMAGYPTVLAQNAEEALVALIERPQIALVLLDIRLPIMNGLNISEIIRKDFPDKKIIVCSVLQKEEQRFLIDHAQDYYYKSEDLINLIEKVEKVFQNAFGPEDRGKNEKRTFRRLPVNVLAGCEWGSYSAPAGSAYFISYTKDLSATGGRFVIGEEIKVGEHFSVSLELPVNFLPLLIDCEVVWVRKLEEFDANTRGSVEAGVRFVKLDSPRDEEKLKNYLNCV